MRSGSDKGRLQRCAGGRPPHPIALARSTHRPGFMREEGPSAPSEKLVAGAPVGATASLLSSLPLHCSPALDIAACSGERTARISRLDGRPPRMHPLSLDASVIGLHQSMHPLLPWLKALPASPYSLVTGRPMSRSRPHPTALHCPFICPLLTGRVSSVHAAAVAPPAEFDMWLRRASRRSVTSSTA